MEKRVALTRVSHSCTEALLEAELSIGQNAVVELVFNNEGQYSHARRHASLRQRTTWSYQRRRALITNSIYIVADSIERPSAARVRRKSSVMTDYDDDVRVDIPNVGDESVR